MTAVLRTPARNYTQESDFFARRRLWLMLSLVLLPQAGCSQGAVGSANSAPTAEPASLSPEDTELKHRFRGIRGGEMITDGLVEMNRVALHSEKGYLIEARTFSPKNRGRSSYGGDDFVMPKTVRMMWYSDDSLPTRNGFAPPAFEGGTLLADVTVPVASRIPLEVLDEARKKGAGLRLKIRVHPEGVLIGWDIERRPGFNPKKLDSYGEARYVEAVHSFVGGDFREAKIYNGQVVRKGWYIEPKAGKKIETDF